MNADPNLRQFATDKQWEQLQAMDAHPTQAAAAKALGISDRSLRATRDQVLGKAARAGYNPDQPNFHVEGGVPKGYVLHGQSANVNKDGELEHRWDKTTREGMEREDATHMPDPKLLKSLSTMTDGDGKVKVQWSREEADLKRRAILWEEFAAKLFEDRQRFEPLPAPEHTAADLMAGYIVGDHHLGMMAWAKEVGEDYDLKIADKLLRGAFTHLTAATMSATHALVAFMGDFLHYDSLASVTPASGNVLDSDTRYGKMIDIAIKLMRYAVDSALLAHDTVRVIVEPGNHDPTSALCLMHAIKIAYEKEERVWVDMSPSSFHYARWGDVLIGTHHGDKVKMKDLPLVMAADRPEEWGQTKWRYWWTGHVHHSSKTAPPPFVDEIANIRCESFRVLAPKDAWHHQKGYRAMCEMNAIVYHKKHGEYARQLFKPGMLD